MAHPDQDFPFPFFGAGQASYYMWAEVHVRFAREPSASQRAVITDTVPAPLRGAIDWCEGRQLMVSSGLSLHGALVRSYPAADGDSDRIDDDGWLHAAPLPGRRAQRRHRGLAAAHRPGVPDPGRPPRRGPGRRRYPPVGLARLEPHPAARPAVRAGAPARPGQSRHLDGPGHPGHGPARRNPAPAWRPHLGRDLLAG
ncbi:hypothetical protein GCM10017559_32160 [Streptosporangium longisporum]|uniref:Uncharacterized protein n=1 Tax=Streptosporangium longisporum TaxID=46187 RepID=A0ABP6KF39_9ACTN